MGTGGRRLPLFFGRCACTTQAWDSSVVRAPRSVWRLDVIGRESWVWDGGGGQGRGGEVRGYCGAVEAAEQAAEVGEVPPQPLQFAAPTWEAAGPTWPS